jgi:hypothetical protein
MKQSKVKFTVMEKVVKERDGEAYSLANYKENEDYVRRAIRYGTRVIFRDTILEAVSQPVIDQVGEPAEMVATQKQIATLRKCKVTRKYPNPRVVETDGGRVFVGGHGSLIKLGQTILVKAGTMVLGRA